MSSREPDDPHLGTLLKLPKSIRFRAPQLRISKIFGPQTLIFDYDSKIVFLLTQNLIRNITTESKILRVCFFLLVFSFIVSNQSHTQLFSAIIWARVSIERRKWGGAWGIL